MSRTVKTPPVAHEANRGSWRRLLQRRPMIGLAVVAAAVVAVVALTVLEQPSRSGSESGAVLPELRALFTALAQGTTRPVEGRLSRGFPYRAVAVETRGPRTSVSPEVQIAAARIEKRASIDASPAASAALSAAYLALGEWDKATAAIEDASAAAAGTASFENDRAVAYMSRAAALDRAEDWATGLAAANRAIALDSAQSEAYFNRAVALRGLRLVSEEVDAWRAYQQVESAGGWFEESTRRLDALRGRPQPKLSDPGVWDHQWVRERIEDQLLRDWGAAFERGDHTAATGALAEARQLAERLAASGGDRMAHDEIEHIRQAIDRRTPMAADLAAGHRLYGEARRLWVATEWSRADAAMQAAAAHFRRGGSRYTSWAHVLHGVVLQNQGDNDGALRLLQSIALPPRGQRYHHLRGRRAWVEGYLWASRGRFDTARTHYAQAIDEFTAAAEYDYLAAMYTNLAEADSYLGDRSNAWSHLVAALEVLDRRGETTRVDQFDIAAAVADDEGLPETALEFRNAMIRVARTPYLEAQGYLRRARTLARLNRAASAADDAHRAELALARIVDPVMANRTRTDLRIVQAEVASKTDCSQAVSRADEALQALTGLGTIRRGALLTLRANCRATLGEPAGARADFRAAISIFESRRTTLAGSGDRARAFTMERTAYRNLVRLDVDADGDVAAAFATAERARAGVLADAWHQTGRDDIGEQRLPGGVAVVYYEVLPDRVLTWVLTRHGRSHLSRGVGHAQVGRWVADMRRAIDRGADLRALQPYSRPLFETLVAPALEAADRLGEGERSSTIAFVPDGPLFGVPFAAIPDAQGRPLLETRVVATAPSLAALILASERLEAFVPDTILAVGDGHDPQASRLPRLPRADAEAIDVAKLYPHPRSTVLTGGNATKRRLLERPASVFHFAGHSVLNERDPMLSRMLLAPARDGGDSSSLLSSEITPARFAGTHVVVLATCEGAAGRPVQGEGAISIARAFFAAGVPSVVASLWPVDDDLQALMLEFHRTLRRTRNPAQALRSAQRVLLEERGPTSPVRVWGGFITLGGLGHSASN
jgi:CHAT domain-containing protein